MSIRKAAILLCMTVFCSLIAGCGSSQHAEPQSVEDGREAKLEAAYAEAESLEHAGEYEQAADYYESLGTFRDSAERLEFVRLEKIRVQIRNTEPGDIITLGSFEQDDDISDGSEEIEWEVLEKEGDRLLVISRYALYSLPFNEKNEEVAWESSSIRKWLNGEFYDSAFSDDEKKLILLSTLEPAVNKVYKNVSAGDETEDHIFLLGASEAEKYFTSRDELMCLPTAYAVSSGAWTTEEYTDASGERTCFWWLRSPGNNEKQAAYVHMEGTINLNGTMVSYGNRTARPALWIGPLN